MKKQTLLLIEDEKKIIKSLYEALKDDYDVSTAENGENAIEVIKKKDIRVIVLDLRLARIRGVQILRIIKNVDTALPVIVLSRTSAANVKANSSKYGVYDIFNEPLDIGALKESVDKAAHTAEDNRQYREQPLPVDMELMIQRALDETLRHNAPLSNALQSFKERYIEFVEEKVLGMGVNDERRDQQGKADISGYR